MSKKNKYYTKAIPLPGGKRKYIRGKTKAELNEKVLRAQIELRSGVDIGNDVEFGAFTQIWFDTVKKPHLRPHSLEILKGKVNNHILPCFSGMKVRDIKPAHVDAFATKISSQAHSTQSSTLSILKAIFRFAVDNDIISKSPVLSAVKASGRETEERVALTPEQSSRLLDALKTDDTVYLFALIGLNTGMRLGEIIGLMWNDVDLDKGYITVTHNKTFASPKDMLGTVSTDLKSKAGNRIIPIPHVLLDELKKRRAGTDALFVLHAPNGLSMDYSWYRNTLHRTLSSALIDVPVHTHLLRHTYITRLFEAGLDIKEVQYLAGHSTINMTLKVYTHYDRASRAHDTARKVREAFSPVKPLVPADVGCGLLQSVAH